MWARLDMALHLFKYKSTEIQFVLYTTHCSVAAVFLSFGNYLLLFRYVPVIHNNTDDVYLIIHNIIMFQVLYTTVIIHYQVITF